MKIEYEVKILKFNKDNIISKFDSLGVKYLWKFNFRRYVYDFNPIDKNKWIRLRTDWVKTFLTIKETKDESIEWMHEIETEILNFDIMNSILEELWYKAKSYQENLRESYIYKNIQIEIDSWPKIPSYIEIEGDSKDEVLKMVNDLWFKESDTTCINTTKIYLLHWIDLKTIKYLTF